MNTYPSKVITGVLSIVLSLLLIIYILSLELWEEKSKNYKTIIKQERGEKIIEIEKGDTVSSSSQIVETTNTQLSSSQISQNQESSSKDTNYDGKLDGKYSLFAAFFTDPSWSNTITNDSFTSTWGEENITVNNDKSVFVKYPAGSYKPSVSPRGGAGFVYNFEESYNSATLSYDITLSDTFDFVKGGKLPGICGGDCSRGGELADNGFSVNFVWQREGVLEATVTSHASQSEFGDTTTNSQSYKLVPGNTYTLEQHITLNTPGKSDGKLILSVNGQEIYRSESENYRNTANISLDSVLFSSFFGGGDESWATPVDTSIIFDNFALRDAN